MLDWLNSFVLLLLLDRFNVRVILFGCCLLLVALIIRVVFVLVLVVLILFLSLILCWLLVVFRGSGLGLVLSY